MPPDPERVNWWTSLPLVNSVARGGGEKSKRRGQMYHALFIAPLVSQGVALSHGCRISPSVGESPLPLANANVPWSKGIHNITKQGEPAQKDTDRVGL